MLAQAEYCAVQREARPTVISQWIRLQEWVEPKKIGARRPCPRSNSNVKRVLESFIRYGFPCG
jgi:hypothetical protein